MTSVITYNQGLLILHHTGRYTNYYRRRNMARIKKLEQQIGPPEHYEACLLCAKIDWLGTKSRQFHRPIGTKEARLRKQWHVKNRLISEDYAEVVKRYELWKKALPRVNEFLVQKKAQIKAERKLDKKSRRLQRYWKNCNQLIADAVVKTRDLSKTFFDYNVYIKKEVADYVKENVGFSAHVYWDNKVSQWLSALQDSHPVCPTNDGFNTCGLRLGGFHSATTLTFLAYEGFYFGDTRCQYCRKEAVRKTKWYHKAGL